MLISRTLINGRWQRAASLARAAACSAVLAVAGCTASAGGSSGGSPGTAPPTSATAGLGWALSTVRAAAMQCATLQVPLDYARPGGRKISLALSRVPATAPASQQQGDLLVNP